MFTIEIKAQVLDSGEVVWLPFHSFNTSGNINEWSIIYHHPLDDHKLTAFSQDEATIIINQLTSATWGYKQGEVRMIPL